MAAFFITFFVLVVGGVITGIVMIFRQHSKLMAKCSGSPAAREGQAGTGRELTLDEIILHEVTSDENGEGGLWITQDPLPDPRGRPR